MRKIEQSLHKRIGSLLQYTLFFFFYKQLDFWLSPQKLFTCLVKNAPKSCLAVVYIKIS